MLQSPVKRKRSMAWPGSSWGNEGWESRCEPTDQADDRIRGWQHNKGLWISREDVKESHSSMTSGAYSGQDAAMRMAAKSGGDPESDGQLDESEQALVEENGRNSEHVHSLGEWSEVFDTTEYVTVAGKRP